jgi:hypothetical protein
MKIIKRTRSTSISGVTLITGVAPLPSLIYIPPAKSADLDTQPD